jgi:hypothetical protein
MISNKSSVISLLIVFLTTALFVQGQDTTVLKRPAFNLKVAVDKKSLYEQDVESAPYVLPDNTIQMYPGETIYIEMDLQSGVIENIHAVQEIRDSSKTVTIGFLQDTKGKIHTQMLLKVTNPFGFPLLYKADIFPLAQKRWISTDVFPVYPRISGYETWQDIIISIALKDWKLGQN